MQKNRRRICIVTGSRADYGLLYSLIREVQADSGLLLQLVVTGSHLVKRFGFTYRKILEDRFKIAAKADLKLDSDSDNVIVRSVGIGTILFGKIFKRLRPNIVVILGDRFELLSVANAALLSRIPIAHIHGGEITEGAYDDCIRNAITKMAYLHFPIHDKYAKRIIKMGESPNRVFNFGAPGLDKINQMIFLHQEELKSIIGLEIDNQTALCTFHPVTLEKGLAGRQIKNLLKALSLTKLRVVFTAPNADPENRFILMQIQDFVKRHPETTRLFDSLGSQVYLSLMKYAGLMIGNSSSGIIEAPSFHLPVVNIGLRQKGRIQSSNVIQSDYTVKSISKAIKKAMSHKFKISIRRTKNPFGGDGSAGKHIKDVLKTADLNNMKKGFFDN